MAATKLILLFAALSVASVSGDLAENLWNEALNSLHNATQKMVTEFNAATGQDIKFVDVMTPQMNALKANITEMLNNVKAEAAAKFGEGFSDKVNISIDSMVNTVLQKMDPGTTLTAEKLKENTVQTLETLTTQFRNLTSLDVPLNEISQTFLQSIKQVSSAVENVVQKVHSDVQST